MEQRSPETGIRRGPKATIPEKLDLRTQAGKLGYGLLWLLGVPIPILLLIFFARGCS